MVNWAELPDEIINEMAKRLHSVEDFVRFGAVCKPWRSVAAICEPSFGPWMMLSEKETTQQEFHPTNFFNIFQQQQEEIVHVSNETEGIVLKRFFDISSKKVIELELPEVQGRRCWGSPHGWLLTIGLDLNIHLLNPLTRHQIRLPSQYNFQHHDYESDESQKPSNIRQHFIDNFALSSHPTHPDCVVMVVYSAYRRLAYASPGDKSWTLVKSSIQGYYDIIFFNHLFYLVDSKGNINFCDASKPHPEVESFMSHPPQLSFLCTSVNCWRFYLVDVCGDLCLVVRVLFSDDNAPQLLNGFHVYKLDFSTKSWIELHSLCNYALFLGTNISFAVSTSDQPQLKSNSIYFTDDYDDSFRDIDCDIGLFDFEEKKVTDPFYYYGDDICSMFCPSLFFTPNLILR